MKRWGERCASRVQAAASPPEVLALPEVGFRPGDERFARPESNFLIIGGQSEFDRSRMLIASLNGNR